MVSDRISEFQQPFPKRDYLYAATILLYNILLVLCHNNHPLDILDRRKLDQPICLPPEGIGICHRVGNLYGQFFFRNHKIHLGIPAVPEIAAVTIFPPERDGNYVFLQRSVCIYKKKMKQTIRILSFIDDKQHF